MRLQRTRDTAPEIALRRALRARGVGYRLHRRLLEGSRRTVDIVFPGARVAVDVRGCFWHGCAEHGRLGTKDAAWWERKVQSNVERDEDTELRLREAGWCVVVVWEHDDVDECAEHIVSLVRARRGDEQDEDAAARLAKWNRFYGIE